MLSPHFWENSSKAQENIEEMNRLKASLKPLREIDELLEDLEVLCLLWEEEGDQEIEEDIQEKLKRAEEEMEKLSLYLLLGDKYDSYHAILSIHPGAGGTESQDWAQMLFRMYNRWAESKGFQVEVIDLLSDDEAGINSVTFLVKGTNAYGYLKVEKGVHRLVRISPFDSSGRRHTSFASVDVVPEVKESPELEINPDDLKIDTFRSSGAGGQHVNKTDSAVRITHLPTGIVAQCQRERSQHSNRDRAMKILRGKLAALYQNQQDEKMAKLRGEQKEIAWGSQIRSYIFHPYSLVKDHRTDTETGNVNSVMDGNIDMFIENYLREKAMKGERAPR